MLKVSAIRAGQFRPEESKLFQMAWLDGAIGPGWRPAHSRANTAASGGSHVPGAESAITSGFSLRQDMRVTVNESLVDPDFSWKRWRR